MQRFIAEDPLGIGDDDINLYAYTRNSPTTLIDPLGESGQQKVQRGQAGPLAARVRNFTVTRNPSSHTLISHEVENVTFSTFLSEKIFENGRHFSAYPAPLEIETTYTTWS